MGHYEVIMVRLCTNCGSFMVREHVTELCQGPAVPAFDGIHGSADDQGYLVECHLFTVMEDENGAMIRMEAVERDPDFFGHGGGFEQLGLERQGIFERLRVWEVIVRVIEV